MKINVFVLSNPNDPAYPSSLDAAEIIENERHYIYYVLSYIQRGGTGALIFSSNSYD